MKKAEHRTSQKTKKSDRASIAVRKSRIGLGGGGMRSPYSLSRGLLLNISVTYVGNLSDFPEETLRDLDNNFRKTSNK